MLRFILVIYALTIINANFLLAQNADTNKSAMELLYEAYDLQASGRLIDYRTKLQQALKKDPKEIRVHMSLADYYLRHVGHFRLALKYTKAAERILYEEYGPPPYYYRYTQALHSDTLSLLSQSRLNLDDYKGALKAVREFKKLGYPGDWVTSSEAWILLKINRVEEAINIIEADLKKNPDNFGNNSNVLGILYSMVGKRKESIEVLNRSINHEFSRGITGNPATPLNNIGEVYKEIFIEDKSEESFLRATKLPDGCEHVLPSLNMALIRISQLRFLEAEQSLINFEACFAQYPLRNGEEHKALLQLVRARIALHNGDADYALKELQIASSRQQWFGKIGTTVNDFRAATYSTFGRALKIKNNHLKFKIHNSVAEFLKTQLEIIENKFKSYWFNRRARQILSEDLNYFEDLYIRHTDSFLEYPTLADTTSGFRAQTLRKRILKEIAKDDRAPARKFYESYLAIQKAKSLFGGGAENIKKLNELISSLRHKKDALLKLELMLALLLNTKEGSNRYLELSSKIYEEHKSALYNAGLKLPVNTSNITARDLKFIKKAGFLISNKSELNYKISVTTTKNKKVINFYKNNRLLYLEKGASIEEIINDFRDKVFTKIIYKKGIN